jgi:hypothetical protein
MKTILTLLAFVLAAVALFAANPAPPNLSGQWRLDLDASTAMAPIPGAQMLVISQSPDDVQFQYERTDGSVLGDEGFETNWIRRQRFKTRTQLGYARARWEHDALVVETTVVLDAVGEQSYSYTERWSVSPDGKTLTQASSDGKKLVFERMPDKARKQ